MSLFFFNNILHKVRDKKRWFSVSKDYVTIIFFFFKHKLYFDSVFSFIFKVGRPFIHRFIQDLGLRICIFLYLHAYTSA